MAGLRQGLAPAAPEGRNAVEDGEAQVSCLARNAQPTEGRQAGEETWGEPLQQGGKRRSRPLPTKAIDEDVGECGSGCLE